MPTESSLLPVSFVADINQLHHDTIQRWRSAVPDNTYEGVFATICDQHQLNFSVWHEHSLDSQDAQGEAPSDVKWTIGSYHQQHQHWIERIDEGFINLFASMEVHPSDSARLNTETPGRVIDRLSIMSLQVFQLTDQLDRVDVDQEHLENVRQQLARLRAEQRDLSQSLVELLEDLLNGRKLLKAYSQMKNYSDPAVHPYTYKPVGAAAA